MCVNLCVLSSKISKCMHIVYAYCAHVMWISLCALSVHVYICTGCVTVLVNMNGSGYKVSSTFLACCQISFSVEKCKHDAGGRSCCFYFCTFLSLRKIPKRLESWSSAILARCTSGPSFPIIAPADSS